MGLHRHKVRRRPGPAEVFTVALTVLAVALMIAGPLFNPGTRWEQAVGQITNVYTYAHATSPDGKPYKVRLAYRYEAEGVPYTAEWDGEWPEAHSPNALLAEEIGRLRESGYPLMVLYDPENPARTTLHHAGDTTTGWWLQLALALGLLVVWYVFVLYPRLKPGS